MLSLTIERKINLNLKTVDGLYVYVLCSSSSCVPESDGDHAPFICSAPIKVRFFIIFSISNYECPDYIVFEYDDGYIHSSDMLKSPVQTIQNLAKVF